MSTILTLVIIPVVYTLFDDLSGALVGAWKYLRAPKPARRRVREPVPQPQAQAAVGRQQ
jgi:hypothetical protein